MKHQLLLIYLLLCGTLFSPETGQAQTACTPVSGLVARFALDEMQGTTAQDATGQVANGTLVNGSSSMWQPSGGWDGGGALALTGSAYLDIPLNWTPQSFTFSFWLKPTRRFDWGQLTGAKARWDAFLFHSSSTGILIVGTDGTNRIEYMTPETVQLNIWQHFVFTFTMDAGGATGVGAIYKNGKLLLSKAGMNVSQPWRGLALGYLGSDALYDEVRVYNRAISAPEVSALYSCTSASSALPPAIPSTNLDRNWSLERTYDGNGNIVAESKQFTDALGRPTQAQARNAATQQVFATQTIYSTGGQPVLQTLAAPINNQNFNYKENFVTAGGTAYSPVNFENTNASNPTPVDATSPGTLGYYFSKQNAQEPLTPITSYPYSLVEPYEGPLGGTRRAAGPGDELRMGTGREAKGRDFPVLQEFDAYIRLRHYFVPGSPNVTLARQALKSVSVNADGREGIVATNKEGQAIISCLSGLQYTAIPVNGFISAEATNTYDPTAPAYQDIHIPAAGSQEVKLTVGGSVRILNLVTQQSYDYPVTSATTGVTPAAGCYAYRVLSDQTLVTLPPGFYRFTSLSGTQWIYYEVHYGNFRYTYYDDAGRIIATVAPNGLPGNTNYVRNPSFEQEQFGTYTPSAWQTGTTSTANASFTETQQNAPAHSGAYYGGQWRPSGPWNAYTYQVINGLPNGQYTLRAWVENTGTGISAVMQAQNYGGAPVSVALPPMADWQSWRQITLANIAVTNGQCEIGFSSNCPQSGWIRFDDVELVRQADDSQPTFVTRNSYDTSGRLLATESNDEGRSEYVYAQDGRIRFSQSALQRTNGSYSYSNYDEVGRVVESGEYQMPSDRTQGQVFESQAIRVYEAEDTQRTAVRIDKDHAGYSGIGFIGGVETAGTSAITFTVLVPSAGTYPIEMRYAVGTGSTQTMSVSVNGGTLQQVNFPNTGSWDNWSAQTTLLTLQAGTNTIRYLYGAADNGRVNIDCISLPYKAMGTANSILTDNVLEDRTSTGGITAANRTQRNQVWYDLPWDGTMTNLDGSVNNTYKDNQLTDRSRQQQFVLGAVSKTKNDNATTWYSYDELGRVTWVVQDLVGVGVKTLDYQYDFSGNVLEVAYQKGQPDSFYHQYEYDAAQRLTTVYTTPTGAKDATRTQQAQYSYYLHGPLKRVQVAGNLQGIDYTYTLQGALKAINHVNQTLEPGHDGPKANGVYKDLFALSLDYFGSDYRSRSIDAPLPIAGGTSVPTRYDGTIQGAAWRTGANADIHRVAYAYDEKSQLQNSTYGKWQLPASTSTSYAFNTASTNTLREGGLTYDANGNMQSLQRTNQQGTVTDNFSYTYQANTNRLKEVHTGSASGATVMDYDYDELGQMTRQRDEQGQRYLTYDVIGKTTGLYLDAARQQPVVTFAYDDRGFRVSKTVYASGTATPTSTTYYVHDVAGNIMAVYDKSAATGTVQRSEVPLYGTSRLGTLTRLPDGTQDYRYELNDHLGNARVVFHKPQTVSYTATMEPDQTSQDNAQFQNLSNRVYDSSAPSGQYIVTGSVGPSKQLAVEKGDTVTFSAMVRGTAGVGTLATNAKTVLAAVGTLSTNATLLLPGTGDNANGPKVGLLPTIARLGVGITITGLLQPRPQTGPTTNATTGNTAVINLHYKFYDTNNTLKAEGDQSITATEWTYLKLGFRIPEAGRLELSSSLVSGSEARYDNVTYEQTGSLIVQEQHQYAYGASLPGLSYTIGNMRYRHGYQGQYAEKDAEIGYESFEARMYNNRTGRWTSPDPVKSYGSPYSGMGNNPVSYVDPDGRDIFILSYARPDGQKLDVNRALKLMYNTVEGKAALDQYMNNPERNIYIAIGNTSEDGDAAAYTYSLPPARANSDYVFNHKWDKMGFPNEGNRKLFEPFDGLKLQNKGTHNSFVSINTTETWDLYSLTMAIGHEIIGHVANGQDDLHSSNTVHTDAKIWGSKMGLVGAAPNSVARSFSNQIVRLKKSSNFENILKLTSIITTLISNPISNTSPSPSPRPSPRPIPTPRNPSWIESSGGLH